MFRPDVIHLHNLHGWYLNLPMLFDYIKDRNIPVVWTLHDCWSFTGQCPHYDMIGCTRWQTGCGDCSQFRSYPKTCFDCSRTMFRKKREWFTGVKNLTIATPSRWLADQVRQSFLKDYPVTVIHNGIDRSVFRPAVSDIRKHYGMEGQYVLLGVAYAWDQKKGLDAFLELRRRLGPEYTIVLVGVDEQQAREMPEGIVPIRRTQSQQELAQLYSAADLFVNPTREDTFPTVNIESLACGTPVLTFDTGGSPECLDETCGAVVKKNDLTALEQVVRDICVNKRFSSEACVKQAEKFDRQIQIQQYLQLYRSMV